MISRQEKFEVARAVAKAHGEEAALKLIPHMLGDFACQQALVRPDFAKLLASNPDAVDLVKPLNPKFFDAVSSPSAVALMAQNPGLVKVINRMHLVEVGAGNCAEVLIKQLEDEGKRKIFFERNLGERFLDWAVKDQALISIALDCLERNDLAKIDGIVAHGRDAVRRELAEYAIKRIRDNGLLDRDSTVQISSFTTVNRKGNNQTSGWFNVMDDYRSGSKSGGYNGWLGLRQFDYADDAGAGVTNLILRATYGGTNIMRVLFLRDRERFEKEMSALAGMLGAVESNPTALVDLNKRMVEIGQGNFYTPGEKAYLAYGVYSTLRFLADAGMVDCKSDAYVGAVSTVCSVFIRNTVAMELNKPGAYSELMIREHTKGFEKKLDGLDVGKLQELADQVQGNSSSAGLKKAFWLSLKHDFLEEEKQESAKQPDIMVKSELEYRMRVKRIRDMVGDGRADLLAREVDKLQDEVISVKPDRHDEYIAYFSELKHAVLTQLDAGNVSEDMLRQAWRADELYVSVGHRKEQHDRMCKTYQEFFEKFTSKECGLEANDLEIIRRGVDEYCGDTNADKQSVYRVLRSSRGSYSLKLVERLDSLAMANFGLGQRVGVLRDILRRGGNDTGHLYEYTMTPHSLFWLRPPENLKNRPDLMKRFLDLREIMTEGEERRLMSLLTSGADVSVYEKLAERLEKPGTTDEGFREMPVDIISKFQSVVDVENVIGMVDALDLKGREELVSQFRALGEKSRRRVISAASAVVGEKCFPEEHELLIFHDMLKAEVSNPGEAEKAYGFMLPHLYCSTRFTELSVPFIYLDVSFRDFYARAVSARKSAQRLLEDMELWESNPGFTEGRKLRGEHSRNFGLMKGDLKSVLVDFLGNVLKFGGVDEEGNARRPNAGKEYFTTYPQDRVVFHVNWDGSVEHNVARREE